MMTRAGVKTVVAGGRPTPGPMQAAAGTRGAALYSSFNLDQDFELARSLDEQVAGATNATIPEVREPGMYIKYAGFNLRDQIRENDPTPLQFKYQAADCRIYYTLSNLYNMTRLWYDVAAAAFTDPSLCVQGSTGYSSSTNTTSPLPPPKPITNTTTTLSLSHQQTFDENPDPGLHAAYGRPIGGNEITLCPSSGVCQDGKSQCKDIDISCAGEGTKRVSACLPPCTNRKGSTSCPGTCNILQTQESKVGLSRQASYGETLYSGLCYPKVGTRKLGCARNPGV